MSGDKTDYPSDPAPPYTERSPALGETAGGYVGQPQYGANDNTHNGQTPHITMSGDKTDYPSDPSPPYTERSPELGETAGGYVGPPQYGAIDNTHNGQTPHITDVQPGASVTQENIAASEMYNGIFINSIVATVLCCWPIGIFAIRRARQAQFAAIMGRIGEADAHAIAARKLMVASIVSGIIFIVIVGIVLI